MVLKRFSLCVSVISFLIFVIGKSDAIQCFSCHLPILASGKDPCINAALEECPAGNSKCLSATFVVSAKSYKVNDQRFSARSCFPDMKGDECEFFLKTVQQLTPGAIDIKYDRCSVCSTDGCNSAPKHKVPAFWFVGVCFVLVTSLLKY